MQFFQDFILIFLNFGEGLSFLSPIHSNFISFFIFFFTRIKILKQIQIFAGLFIITLGSHVTKETLTHVFLRAQKKEFRVIYTQKKNLELFTKPMHKTFEFVNYFRKLWGKKNLHIYKQEISK